MRINTLATEGEMIFGICSRGSVRLSEIARSLEESIPLIKTIDRLSENLARESLRKQIVEEILQEGSCRISPDTLLMIDPSDINKPYAKKMESGGITIPPSTPK